VRHISRNLRPSELDDLGLASAVRSLCQDFQDRTSLALEARIGPLPEELPTETELNVYRIIQEALANIEKHARAGRVTVALDTTSSFLQLSIADDGVGLASARAKPAGRVAKPGMGLLDSRERATIAGGSCEFKSIPGLGTEILLRIPLPSPATAKDKPIDKATKKKNQAVPGR
jgi:two-component system NarL family sensor kinase